MQSVKGGTSYRMNRLHGRRGRNWQPESYDRIVRNDRDLSRTVLYVLQNPARAGLGNWPWVWPRYDGQAEACDPAHLR